MYILSWILIIIDKAARAASLQYMYQLFRIYMTSWQECFVTLNIVN